MDNAPNPTTLPSLIRIGYGLALVLLIGPVIDLAVATWPWQPGSVQWRFGLLGLLGNALLLPTVALGLMAITAASLSHRRVLRAISVVALLAGVVLAVALLSLGLDALQLRRSIRADLRPGYDYGAARVAVNYLLAMVMTGWIGIAGWRATKKATADHRTAMSPAKASPVRTHRALVKG